MLLATQASGPADAAAKFLKHERALARKAGIPLTMKQYEAAIAVPAAGDAGPLYTKAIAMINAAAHGKWTNFEAFNVGKPEVTRADRRIVELTALAMKLVAQGARKPHCRANVDEHQLGFSLPTQSQMKLLARIAAAECELTSAAGHPAEALRKLATFAPLCRHMAYRGGLVQVLTQNAAIALFGRAVEDVLENHGHEPGVATAAMKCLQKLDLRPDMRWAIQATNVELLDSMDSAAAGPLPSDNEIQGQDKDMQLISKASRTPGAYDLWRGEQIKCTLGAVAILNRPMVNDLARSRELDTYSDNLVSKGDFDHLFLVVVASPSFGQELRASRAAQTHIHVLMQGAAILAHRTPPAKLPLTGPAAKDGLGVPLHYVRSGQGFKVYGLNVDGIDHHGRPHEVGKPGDVMFVYPRPAKPAPQH